MIDNKIQRVSMRQDAYEIIKNAIISGDLEPGRKVRDSELSEMLGISRTPVREAILRLEDEEFVISKPNSYTMVAPINIDEAQDIYKIVIALEKLALHDAIVNATEKDIAKLESINEAYSKALSSKDAEKALESDVNFHHFIVSLSQNNELKKMIGKIKDKVLRIESFYFQQSSPKQKSLKEHKRIIQGIKNREFEEASNMLAENWMNSLKHILSE